MSPWICISISSYKSNKDTTYRRLGFDCEILMIANCEFSEACNQKNHKVSLSVLLSGSTITIIRIAVLLDEPNSQSLNYIIKTRPYGNLLYKFMRSQLPSLFLFIDK